MPSVLQLSHITKTFGSVVANDDVSLSLNEGEMVALLGENGAGKTTLMSILFGHYVADSGSVEVFGETLPAGSPRAALEAGIGMVHQHFTLAGNMTVLENIMLGTESLLQMNRNQKRGLKRLRSLMDRFGLAVDPLAYVSELSVGEQQRVEILKVLYRDARILILDEPTSVLTPQEADRLFETLRTLVDDGVSVIFITHKMREVMAASDRCAVLRHGAVVFESPTNETTAEELAHAMVGSEIPRPERAERTSPADKFPNGLLELRGIHCPNSQGQQGLRALNLTLKPHQILGIAGVSGNGQTELANLLSGLVSPQGGTVLLEGEEFDDFSPISLIRKGFGRIPDDRVGTGLIADMSIMENLSSEVYRFAGFSKWRVLNFKALASRAKQLVEAFDVRCPSLDISVRKLSGGNMQKLILARVLSGAPKIILANQPTWGLDVGATAYVHQQLLDAAVRGVGIILISEDLDELLNVTDTIQVMYHGMLSAPQVTKEVSRAEIGLLMAGEGSFQRSQPSQKIGSAV